jgi:ABC-type phosphate transport system substrate-binding protein
MRLATKAKVGLCAAGAAGLALAMTTPAFADVQPRATDAVAVGSDTVQYIADFGADGTPTGLLGYNATNTSRRVVSFDATADASGRAAYQNGSSTQLSSTIVLRAGSNPIARPNGSGAGITALLNDSTHQIDFVRSSRLPKGAEQIQASTTPGFGAGIHVFQIATDALQIAVNATGAAPVTNAPAALSCDNLLKIYQGTYKKWSDVPGYTGPAPNDGIVPVIPQTGSGTRNDFLADLANTCNGGTAVTLAGNVAVGEEHDPGAITGITSHTDVNGNPVTKADGIEPFSTGRFNLIQTGYFGTAAPANSVSLLGGTSYSLARALYFLCRDADVTSTTPFQLGSPNNLVQTLFGRTTSWFGRAANSGLFTAAGVTQAWADLGLASAG